MTHTAISDPTWPDVSSLNVWLDTASGGRICLTNPQSEDVVLDDIVNGLAYTCRFGGQSTKFFSVAQHALLVEEIISRQGHSELALAALHHDSHEAYLCDMPSPIKRILRATGQFGAYAALQQMLDDAISTAFRLTNVDEDAAATIKQADLIAFEIEARHLLASGGHAAIADQPLELRDRIAVAFPEPLAPHLAAQAFVQRHYELAPETPGTPMRSFVRAL